MSLCWQVFSLQQVQQQVRQSRIVAASSGDYVTRLQLPELSKSVYV